MSALPYCSGTCAQGRKPCDCPSRCFEAASACTELGADTKPRRNLWQRLVAEFRRRWDLRALRSHQLSLSVLLAQNENELEALLTKKAHAIWLKTPTLDAQIRAAKAECEKVEKKLDEIGSEIERLLKA